MNLNEVGSRSPLVAGHRGGRKNNGLGSERGGIYAHDGEKKRTRGRGERGQVDVDSEEERGEGRNA